MATKQEVAADAMLAMARDGNIGYSQGAARTGLRGITPAQIRAGYVTDTDCSFSVAWALEYAGFIPESVLFGTIWTGNQASVYAQYGATNYAYGTVDLQVGDVLLSNGHTAMVVPYNGGLGIAEASLNELGDIVGGALGDQTGGETKVGPLRRGSWHTVQRWPITQSGKITLTEEDELMAAKDEILDVLKKDLAYQNQKIDANMKEIKLALARIDNLQKAVDNVNKGLGYQNQVYLSPTKDAVARIDKKTK